MDNKKQTVIIGLLIVNLLLIIFLSFKTKSDINHATSEVHMLRQELNNVQQHIITSTTNHVEALLTESNNKIDNFTTTITNIDPNEKKAELKLNFEVKDFSGDGEAIVLYKTEKEENWIEVETSSLDAIQYEAIFSVALDGNYEFRVVEKSTDNSLTQLNAHNLGKNLYAEFYEYRTYIDSFGFSETKDHFNFNVSLNNNNFGLDEYNIKSISAKILYKAQVLLNKDITEFELGSREELDRRRVEIASGQVTNHMEKNDHIYVQGSSNIQSMLFDINLDKDDIIKDFPNLSTSDFNVFSDDPNVRNDFGMELHIVFNNGEDMKINY